MKIKTHILCSMIFSFFFLENRVLYGVMGKVVYSRTERILRIPNATNTHSEYLVLTALPLQQQLHESALMLRYTFIVCLVFGFLKSLFDEGVVTFCWLTFIL